MSHKTPLFMLWITFCLLLTGCQVNLPATILPVPLIEYLPKNLWTIRWHLDGWALWMDILAWAGLYLSVNRSSQRKVGMV